MSKKKSKIQPTATEPRPASKVEVAKEKKPKPPMPDNIEEFPLRTIAIKVPSDEHDAFFAMTGKRNGSKILRALVKAYSEKGMAIFGATKS